MYYWGTTSHNRVYLKSYYRLHVHPNDFNLQIHIGGYYYYSTFMIFKLDIAAAAVVVVPISVSLVSTLLTYGCCRALHHILSLLRDFCSIFANWSSWLRPTTRRRSVARQRMLCCNAKLAIYGSNFLSMVVEYLCAYLHILSWLFVANRINEKVQKVSKNAD